MPNQSYTEGVAISALVLPEAGGGNGSLTYSLTPSIPGLSFDQNSRTLTGTPTTAGTHDMTYQVQDGDANTAASDAATLTFAVNIQPPRPHVARGLLGRRGNFGADCGSALNVRGMDTTATPLEPATAHWKTTSSRRCRQR